MNAVPYPIVTEDVGIPVDEADFPVMNAYTARPDAPGAWPVVLVGFEMFGITPYIRRTADRLAGMGYLAVVPDFYHRTAPGFAGVADDEGRAAGFALLQRLARDEVRRDVEAVLAHMAKRPEAGAKSGMMGVSLGGHLAYFAATQTALTATAVVYPGWLDVTGTALGKPDPLLTLTPGIAEHGGRLLYLMGADDHVVTPDQNRLAAEALTAAGVPHEVVVYPNAPHGFLADERDTFRQDLADDTWQRIAGLFAKELREE